MGAYLNVQVNGFVGKGDVRSLIEIGIPASTVLSKFLGVRRSEVFNKLEKREVSFSIFKEAFECEINQMRIYYSGFALSLKLKGNREEMAILVDIKN